MLEKIKVVTVNPIYIPSSKGGTEELKQGLHTLEKNLGVKLIARGLASRHLDEVEHEEDNELETDENKTGDETEQDQEPEPQSTTSRRSRSKK